MGKASRRKKARKTTGQATVVEDADFTEAGAEGLPDELFPRCEAITEDGRRCWCRPGHKGKHVIAPPGAARTERLKKALRRIVSLRGDVASDLILLAWMREVGIENAGSVLTPEELDMGGAEG